MPATPKLSVVTISYNQDKFITQTLQGIVDQQINFDIEIIVADDASSDNTQKIIKEYQQNYPKLFTTILRKKNVGAWNNFKEALNKTNGEYVALCEGDDYWTDPTKLQRQVDFMDSNRDYSICFHPVRVVFEDGKHKESVYPPDKKGFTLDRLLQGNFIQTNSVVYRRQDYKNLADYVIPGDWYLHLYHAQFGKIGFIDREMSIYRRHPAGMWWDSANDADKFWGKHSLGHFSLCNEILEMYGHEEKHRDAIKSIIVYVCNRTVDYDTRKRTDMLTEGIKLYPQVCSVYTRIQQRVLSQKEAEILQHTKENEVLRNELGALINEYEHQLKTLRTSKTFQLGDAILHHPSKLPSLISSMLRKSK